MPKTPKEDCKEAEELPQTEDKNVWSKDQKTRQYYYDDAHGYEIYREDEADDDEDEKDSPDSV